MEMRRLFLQSIVVYENAGPIVTFHFENENEMSLLITFNVFFRNEKKKLYLKLGNGNVSQIFLLCLFCFLACYFKLQENNLNLMSNLSQISVNFLHFMKYVSVF